MRPIVGRMFEVGLGAEIIYSFVIIVCSLMVYYGTKELYNLSGYKGLKYFRQAFLFFAIAYFFRSFVKFIVVYFNLSRITDFFPRIFLGPVTLFLFMYFSSIAVFYLLYSVMWRKWEGNSKRIFLFHLLALAIAAVSVWSGKFVVFLGLNIFLLAFIVLVVCIAYLRKRKKKNNLYAIYALLLVFWVLNIFDILVPGFFKTFRLLIYMASSGIFLVILYKVLKKSGSG